MKNPVDILTNTVVELSRFLQEQKLEIVQLQEEIARIKAGNLRPDKASAKEIHSYWLNKEYVGTTDLTKE